MKKYHDDVIKWKHFPRYWPFVRKASVFSLICVWNKVLSKQSGGWWLDTLSRPLWRHCNVPINQCSIWHWICHIRDRFTISPRSHKHKIQLHFQHFIGQPEAGLLIHIHIKNSKCRMIYVLLWIRSFFSRVRRYANHFHEWRSHEG